MIECGRCGVRNSDDLYFCKSCGARLVSPEVLPDDRRHASVSELRSAVEAIVLARRAQVEPLPAPRLSLPAPAPAAAPAARIVSLDAGGSDGHIHLLGDGAVDLGRDEGDILLDDPFLASRHARISTTAEGYVLRPLERRNGVFRRLRGPVELADGDKLLVGSQLLRFEIMPELERVAPPGIENGLIVFGSRVRAAWGRLYQLTPEGIPRDIHHLGRAEVVIGREKTDIVFSDDELLSPRHARVTLQAGRAFAEDLGSDGGTFVSVRELHVLEPGDVFRMGNHVFRFQYG
jgi:pSer/pThr/pTyr-binding forkhead associated (FHA) protein